MLEGGYLLAKLKFVHHRVQKSKAEAAPMFAHTRACVRRPQTGTISGTTILVYRYTIPGTCTNADRILRVHERLMQSVPGLSSNRVVHVPGSQCRGLYMYTRIGTLPVGAYYGGPLHAD